MNLVTGQIWKLATIAAGVLTLVISGLLTYTYFEKEDLIEQKTELVRQITDPNTGFIAQLAQSRANVTTLKVQLETQRASFQSKEAEGNAKLKATEAKLAAAQVKTQAMERRLASFLATKPQGATLEDRIRDIDARGMAEMVQ